MPLILLVTVSILIILLLFFISLFFAAGTSTADFEKLSAYECGFEPFSDTQGTFDVKYYLLGILFMVFDLEIMFLLPWSVSFDTVDYVSFVVMQWFLVVLVIAFVYEWLKGALE